MGLLRIVARSMLASYFVVNGVKAIAKPQELADVAAPLTDAVVPAIKRYAPLDIAARIPEDPTTLVRINGILQAAGGLALATGFGRRFGAVALAGSLIPSTLARYPFWTRTDRAEKAADRQGLIKNVALLGGVLIAAGDTEGRPSLAWRAADTKRKLGKEAGRAVDAAGDTVRRSGRAVRREAKHAAHDAKIAARSAARSAKLAAKDVQLSLS